MKTVCVLVMLWAGAVQAECRQALALGLDVSGSVDAREYRLQLDGLAAALTDPEVEAALFALPDAPVALAVYEWSGSGARRQLVDWTVVSGPPVLTGVASALRQVQREAMDPATALGEAKGYGAGLLGQQGHCWRRVLDLSGDGESNAGPRPQDVRPAGVTINALVVQGEEDLVPYFRAYVIEGEEAFVETARGFEDFEAAMVRKLKRELQVMVLSER